MKLLKEAQQDCLSEWNYQNNSQIKMDDVEWGFDSRRFPENTMTLLCLIQNGEVMAKFDLFSRGIMHMD